MNLNKITLIGRTTKVPELKHTPSGVSVATFGLATNNTYTDKSGQKKETTSFHNIVVWGRQAENAAKYLLKGQEVYVEGRIDYREWDKTDGSGKGKITEVIAAIVQFGQKPKGAAETSYREDQEQSMGSSLEREHEALRDSSAGEGLPQIDMDDDDIKPENLPF